jgi:proteasome alpha subunit
MSMPFYVSPEQVMADKAEFARKGISRGKSIVALEHQGGVLMMAENATTLNKIGEIYDRLAFCGVGKFSEFDQLRKVGVRFADTKGYAYSREDVRGRGLANAFSQVIGEVFTREIKPLELEIIVAEVADDRYEDHKSNSLYRIKYDGFISDYRESMPAGEAAQLGRRALSAGAERSSELDTGSLEVCLLDRDRTGRKFCRLSADEVQGMLDGS